MGVPELRKLKAQDDEKILQKNIRKPWMNLLNEDHFTI